MTTRVRRICTVTAFAALAAAGCGGADAGTTPPPASGDPSSLVVLSPAQATSYAADGGATGGVDGSEVVMNTQATLIRNPYVSDDAPGTLKQDWYKYEPLLAERFEVSDDQLTYTFYLRKGVKSPAGNELTADDVLWSYERKWNSVGSAKFINQPYLIDLAQQMKKVDEYTVSVSVARPSDGFTLLSLMGNLTGHIYDSDMLKEHATEADPYAIEWSKTNPNWGYGAYTVERLVPGEETVLVANPSYVLGEPEIKRITYRVVSDPGTRANAVRAGDADIATQLRPADQEDLQQDENVQIFDVDTNAFLRIPMNVTKPPFDNTKVRQALAWAIPYEEIINGVYRGNARQMQAILKTDAPGYDGSGLEKRSYDPAKAKQLLAEAGFPDGVDITLTVASTIPDTVEAAVLVQSFAKDAGFRITLNQLPAAEYTKGTNEGAFQAFIGRDYAITMSPPYELLVWTTPGSRANWSKWDHKPFYDAVDEGIAAGDPLTPEAGKAWNKAERIMQEETPMAFICYIEPFFAFSTSVEGFAFRSDNILDYSVMSRKK